MTEESDEDYGSGCSGLMIDLSILDTQKRTGVINERRAVDRYHRIVGIAEGEEAIPSQSQAGSRFDIKRMNSAHSSPHSQDEQLREPLLSSQQQQDHQVEVANDPLEEELHDETLSRTTATVTSPNVHLTLAYTLFAFAGRSIWSQSVLAAYVYLIRNNSPEAVGFITASLGISQLVASVPSGILADSWTRRETLLKIASMVGCVAVLFCFLALHQESYEYLTLALSLWGVYYGITNTTISALFADSIPRGDRSYYFSQRTAAISLGGVCGPTVALLMFQILGDHWTCRDCAIVMAVGQCINVPAVMLLCWFSDDYKVEDHNIEESAAETGPDTETVETIETVPQETAANDEEEAPSGFLCIPQNRLVPGLIGTSDVIAGLSSGMSIRYFPIFFKDYLHLNPAIVQSLYLTSPLLRIFVIRRAQQWSKQHGRMHVATWNKWIGIGLMLLMVVVYLAGAPSLLVGTIYIVRTAMVNSTNALTKSMLMDHVPSSERGKWAALESVNMFSWSGSAALGGILVEEWGMLPVFCLTAAFQLIGTLPMVSLWKVDTMEVSATRSTRDPEEDETTPS